MPTANTIASEKSGVTYVNGDPKWEIKLAKSSDVFNACWVRIVFGLFFNPWSLFQVF